MTEKGKPKRKSTAAEAKLIASLRLILKSRVPGVRRAVRNYINVIAADLRRA